MVLRRCDNARAVGREGDKVHQTIMFEYGNLRTDIDAPNPYGLVIGCGHYACGIR